MKAVLIEPITIDEEDRTVDATVQLSSDAGTPLSTKVILIPVDDFSEALTIDKVKDLLNKEITKTLPIPLTEQDVKDRILDLTVTIPG